MDRWCKLNVHKTFKCFFNLPSVIRSYHVIRLLHRRIIEELILGICSSYLINDIKDVFLLVLRDNHVHVTLLLVRGIFTLIFFFRMFWQRIAFIIKNPLLPKKPKDYVSFFSTAVEKKRKIKKKRHFIQICLKLTAKVLRLSGL